MRIPRPLESLSDPDAWTFRGGGAELTKDMESASGAGFRSLGIGTKGDSGEVHPHLLPNNQQTEGALDVTPLPKRPRGSDEGPAVLIPGDEAEGDAGPVNVYANRLAEPSDFRLCQAKIIEAAKAIQDIDWLAEENVAKIAELSSRLAAAERAMVEAKEKAVVDYGSSEEFTVLLDKEVMDQCNDLVYRFK
ncbi:unnamed protein product [Prunus brigantina]